MFQIFPVGVLTQYLRLALESDSVLQDLWVAGEVSNLSRPSSGHVYFSLKDETSQLRCVLFRQHAIRSPRFENGDEVVVHGRVSFYDAAGQLQVYSDVVQPEGVGRLHLEFLALQARLEEEGLFDPLRKRPIPRYPRRIAVVTSPSGAVFHDICTVIERRYPVVEIILVPTAVQGAAAAARVCQALASAAQVRPMPDTIILARGGGSVEDLWTFNEESVARAIFASPIPVISGVGHETDVTIADLVADLRAPTPSVAAELAVPDRNELLAQIGALEHRLSAAIDVALADQHDRLQHAVGQLRRLPDGLGEAEDRLQRAVGRAAAVIAQRYRRASAEHRARCLTLQALSPLLTLARGFAAVSTTADGAAVTSVAAITAGQPVDVRLRDGGFTSEVRSLWQSTQQPAPTR